MPSDEHAPGWTLQSGSSGGSHAWDEAIASHLMPLQIAHDDDTGREWVLRVADVGGVRVLDMSDGPQTWRRPWPHVERSDTKSLQVLCMVRGRAVLEQYGRRAEVHPGHLVLFGSGEPLRLRLDVRFRCTLFRIPIDSLDLTPADVADGCAVAIPADAGLCAVAASFLRALAVAAQAGSIASEGGSLASVVAQLVGALVRADHKPSVERPDSSVVLLRLAERCIADHLADPQLGPGFIARHINVSVRRVHQLFASTESSVGQRIRAARLRGVRRDLRDPLLRSLSIARVAARNGFPNASVFARAFREEHGCTPSEFRRGTGSASQTGTHA